MGRFGGKIRLCAFHSSGAYNKTRVKTHCYALSQLSSRNSILLGIDVAQTDGRQETRVRILTAEKREFGAMTTVVDLFRSAAQIGTCEAVPSGQLIGAAVAVVAGYWFWFAGQSHTATFGGVGSDSESDRSQPV